MLLWKILIEWWSLLVLPSYCTSAFFIFLVIAYTKSYLQLETGSHNFSTKPFILNRALARSMPWLTSFAWANSTCDEREPRITK